MSKRVRMAGFGEGAPENDQLLEASARLANAGGHPRIVSYDWNEDRSLIVCFDKDDRPVMWINPDDFVALGGSLP